jgi:hypothetical protein
MTNHQARTTANVNRVIRRHMNEAGYHKRVISDGIAYAAERGPYTAREGFILAVSYALFGREECDSGARFAVEDGYGPK